MIVLDPEEQQQLKASSQSTSTGHTVRAPDRVTVAERTSSWSSFLLPDYETSQALHRGRYRNLSTALAAKFDSRLWKPTLYALGIYVALSIVIGVPLIIGRTHKHRGFPLNLADANYEGEHPDSSGGVFVLDGENLDECKNFELKESESTFAAFSHSFNSSKALRFRSNITSHTAYLPSISGNFDLGINPDSSQRDLITTVYVNTSNSEIRDALRICVLDGPKHNGATIYVPTQLQPPDFLALSVSVLLPSTSPPLFIPSLDTNLPFFRHHIKNFTGLASIPSVSLEGFREDITCDDLTAKKVIIKNSLGGITGTFNTTHELHLDTVEGSISADITLSRGPHQKGPTLLHVDTGNREIDTNITLVAPSNSKPWEAPADFVGNIRTFNAPLNINLQHGISTPPVAFDFHIQNNQAAVNVTMDGKFTGLFAAQTKLATAEVRTEPQGPSVDPSGRGRERKVYYDHRSQARVSGWIGWGVPPALYDPSHHGRLDVVSSLEPVSLQLGPGST